MSHAARMLPCPFAANTSPDPSTDKPLGAANPPAIVICVPVPGPAAVAGSSTIRLFPSSAMKTSPTPSTATADALDKPLPKDTDAPADVISKTRLLDESAMNRSPAASTATVEGWLKPLLTMWYCLLEPAATRMTEPAAVLAMKIFPEPSTATPSGELNPVTLRSVAALLP